MLYPIFLLSSLLSLILPSTAFPWGGPQREKPIFTIKSLSYFDEIIYSTPAHNAVHYGTVDFNFTNTAVPYTTQCSATSQQWPDFFYGEIVYSCSVPAEAGPGASASFTFNKDSGLIALNQTWSCDTWGREETFLGYGSATANIHYVEEFWQNPNFTLADVGVEMYSIQNDTGSLADFTIVPMVIVTN